MSALTKLSNRATITATRPENELLLCCVRPQIDTATGDRIKFLLQQQIDWAYLTKIAVHHKVMPLLYQSLNNSCPEVVPDQVLTQLQNYFDSNAIRNLFLTNKLFKLLNLFEQNGIQAIPYKGAVLATSVYGSPFLRQFADLDILVRPQDVTKVRELLISQGYLPRLDFDWEQHFWHEESQIDLDLHWAFTPKSFPCQAEDFQELWQRLEPVSLAGKTIVSFAPEDLLLVLGVDIAKDCTHNRLRLYKLCDLIQLLHVHQSTIDWSRVLERSNRLGSEQLFLLGLSLTNEYLGTELPERIIEKIQTDPLVKLNVRQIRQQLFAKDDSQRHVFEFCLSRILMHEYTPVAVSSYSQIFWYFLRFAITPTMADRNFLPMPTYLGFLYYLIRPIRLVAGKYGLKLLKSC